MFSFLVSFELRCQNEKLADNIRVVEFHERFLQAVQVVLIKRLCQLELLISLQLEIQLNLLPPIVNNRVLLADPKREIFHSRLGIHHQVIF